MTDLPADFTTGQIIRHLRERRGMSRPVLAGLVGYSAEWLKRVEAGQRGISLPALIRIARILRVTDLSTFIDGGVPMPVSAWDGPAHPAAVAVREIVDVTSFARSTRSDLPDVAELAGQVAAAWRDWHTLPANRTAVTRRLPSLIAELEDATVVQAHRAAHAALASAYCLAQHLAVDITGPEVGRVLVDRAARAAKLADDPVSLAIGAWSYGHVLRGIDADRALRVVSAAADELERHLTDDADTAGLLGSLHLHCAVSAAHVGEDGAAWRFWDVAETIGRRLPADYSHPVTAFGAANVAIHGVSIASLLRRPGEAVQRAARIDADSVPSRERRGRLFGEIAEGHLERREYADALRCLDRAYRTAPEATPFSPLTRGVTVELVRSARGQIKGAATTLAERMGVLPAA